MNPTSGEGSGGQGRCSTGVTPRKCRVLPQPIIREVNYCGGNAPTNLTCPNKGTPSCWPVASQRSNSQFDCTTVSATSRADEQQHFEIQLAEQPAVEAPLVDIEPARLRAHEQLAVHLAVKGYGTFAETAANSKRRCYVCCIHRRSDLLKEYILQSIVRIARRSKLQRRVFRTR